MKPSNRSFRDLLQNIAICALVISAVFLLYQTKLIHVNPINHVISSVAPLPEVSASGSMQSHAPLHIACRTGSECRAWIGISADGTIFESFGPALIEAIGSAKNESAGSEAAFRRALENDHVYYDFMETLPLPVLADIIGCSSAVPDLAVRSLLLCNFQDKTAELYGWNEEKDTYYRWTVTVPASDISGIAERHGSSPAEFAFLMDAPYSALSPYTLIPGEPVTLQNLTVSSTLQKPLEDAILTSLEFNVHSNSRYPESNGTEVIVHGTRTLRFTPGGAVLYSGNEKDSTALLTVEHAGEDASEAECIDAAWRLLSVLLTGCTGDAAPYLSSVETAEDGSTELTFGYAINGIPIAFQEDSAARIEIRSNAITAFTLHFRSYTASENMTALLPVFQASAAALSEAPCDLFPGYYDDGSAVLVPCWLRK